MITSVNHTRLVDAAKELLKSSGYFVDNLWHADDVRLLCEQQGMERLSDMEAMEVFTIANDQFDGETGISWPQLERALSVFVQRKELMQELCDTVE